ncbi:MAG: hypothetical protein V3T14_04230 [Myxococcota bacterium]
MKKLACSVTAAALFLALVGAPRSAPAADYEDGLEACAYPVMFDVVVMRTLSLGAVVLGAGLWFSLAPWVILTAPMDLDLVTSRLVGRPLAFTFGRPIGACGR